MVKTSNSAAMAAASLLRYEPSARYIISGRVWKSCVPNRAMTPRSPSEKQKASASISPISRPSSGYSMAVNCCQPLRPRERISLPRVAMIASSGGPSVATAKGSERRLLAITTTTGAAVPIGTPRVRTRRKKPSDSTTAGTAR